MPEIQCPVRQDHYLRWDPEYDAYYCDPCFTWSRTLKVHAGSVEGYGPRHRFLLGLAAGVLASATALGLVALGQIAQRLGMVVEVDHT